MVFDGTLHRVPGGIFEDDHLFDGDLLSSRKLLEPDFEELVGAC